MSGYRGKKVLICGGSKGIGRSLAISLAGQGAHVVVAARGQEALDETVDAMRAASEGETSLGSVVFDVTDMAQVTAGCRAALDLLGGLDVLVCNSGAAFTGAVEDVDVDTFEAMMNLNYLGHVRVVHALAPHFKAQGSGDICLVPSMLGFLGLYGYSAYSASKFAIVGFAQALRQEMGLHGVGVSVFYPPTTETPGLEKENESKPAVVWALESDSGWNRIYTADQVAGAILKHIARGKFEGVIGSDSKLIFVLARYFPGLTRYFADQDLKKAIAKVAASG
jgi:3-dehydrosphinganine reductase